MLPLHRVVSLIVVQSALVLAQPYRFEQQVGFVPGVAVMTEGVILADLDLDGRKDIVFANGYVLSIAGQAIAPDLFMNRITLGGGIVNETAARFPAPLTAIRGTQVVAFDIERDGDPDLVFTCNGTTQQRLYVNDGTGHFSDQSVARLGTLVMSSTCAAYGDVDGDGDLDLFVNDEATSGQLRLLLNDGLGFFTNVTATHLPVAPKTNQQDINVVDLDNDWDLDVVNCGKSSGQQIFLNDGTGHFSVTTALLPAGTTLTYETDPCDLDNDGDMDLAMLSTSGLTDSVLRNNVVPNGTLSFTASSAVLTGGNGDDDNEFVYVDANDDGLLDIVIGSLQAASEKLYLNNGAFSFARQSGFAGFSPVTDSTLDVALGDLNGDGRLDMVTAQGESGIFTNRVYYGSTPDTRGPRFVRVRDLPDTTNPAGPWKTRAVIQDSGVDDSETTLRSVTLDWSIAHRGGTSVGSVPMAFLGGLMWEAAITPPTGLPMLGGVVTWTLTAIDPAGNPTTTPVRSFRICGSETYGSAVGGTNTATLSLFGTPSLGATITLAFGQAPPNTPGLLALCAERAALAVNGGTLLVDLGGLVALAPITSDAAGLAVLPVQIPADPVLVGLRVDLQAAFDPPFRFTNGLEIALCP